jgi:hypothetical protein
MTPTNEETTNGDRFIQYVGRDKLPQKKYVYTPIVDIDKDWNQTYIPKLPILPKNQGNTNKCVAFSLASLLELQQARKTGDVPKLDPNYIWNNGAKGGDGMYIKDTLGKLQTTQDSNYKVSNFSRETTAKPIKEQVLNNHGALLLKKNGKVNHVVTVTGYKYDDGIDNWRVQDSLGGKEYFIPFNDPSIIEYYKVK